MNKILTIVFLLICCVSFAGQEQRRVLALDTNGTSVITFGSVRGQLDAVYVSFSNSSTADVTIAYSPANADLSDINIATNTIVGTKVFRPRVKGTDVAGADITYYTKYVLAGEEVVCTVTNGASEAECSIVLILE